MIIKDTQKAVEYLDAHKAFDFSAYLPFSSNSLYHIPPQEKALIEKKFNSLLSLVIQQQGQIAELTRASVIENDSSTQLKNYQDEIERLENEVLQLRKQAHLTKNLNGEHDDKREAFQLTVIPPDRKTSVDNQLELDLKNKLNDFNESFLILYKVFKNDHEKFSQLKSQYQSLQSEKDSLSLQYIELQNLYNKNESEIQFLSKLIEEKTEFSDHYAALASQKETENSHLRGKLKILEETDKKNAFIVEQLKSDLLKYQKASALSLSDNSEDDIPKLRRKLQMVTQEKQSLGERVVFLEESFGNLSGQLEEIVKQNSEGFESLYDKYVNLIQNYEDLVLKNIDLEKAVEYYEQSQSEFAEQRKKIEDLCVQYQSDMLNLKTTLLNSDWSSPTGTPEALKDNLEKIFQRNRQSQRAEKDPEAKVEKLLHIINFISQTSMSKPSILNPQSPSHFKNNKKNFGDKSPELARNFAKKPEERSIIIEDDNITLLSKMNDMTDENYRATSTKENISGLEIKNNLPVVTKNINDRNEFGRTSILGSHVKFRDDIIQKNADALTSSTTFKKQNLEGKVNEVRLREPEGDPVLKYLKELEKKNEELFSLRRQIVSLQSSTKHADDRNSEKASSRIKLQNLERQLQSIEEIYRNEKSTLLSTIEELKEELCKAKMNYASANVVNENIVSELRKQIKNLAYRVKIYEDQINDYNK